MEPLLHSKPQSHGPPTMFSFSFCFSQEIQVLSCREHWEKPCRNTGLFCWATVAKNATVQKARCTLIQCTPSQSRGLPTSFPKGTPTFMGKQTFTDFRNQSTNVFTDFLQAKHERVYVADAPKAQVRLRQGKRAFTDSKARSRLRNSQGKKPFTAFSEVPMEIFKKINMKKFKY